MLLSFFCHQRPNHVLGQILKPTQKNPQDEIHLPLMFLCVFAYLMSYLKMETLGYIAIPPLEKLKWCAYCK